MSAFQQTTDFIDSIDSKEIEVYTVSAGVDVPGLEWVLSDDTEQTMRDIDANIRAAEQLAGHLMLR